MLQNIRQTDSELIKPIRDYGCFFLCYAQISPELFSETSGRKRLNDLWNKAVEEGIISGDMNCDGDVDDIGEAEIQDHNALLALFGIDAVYHGADSNPSDFPDEEVVFIIGKFKWKGSHFVIINKIDEVTFDPIGHSYTVKNGTLVSRRRYYAGKKS